MSKRIDKQTSTLKRRVGQRMKQAAQEAGMNGKELATALGLPTPSTVYKYFDGEDIPRVDRLEEIARVLNKEVWWFFGEQRANAIAEEVARVLVDLCKAVMAGERPGEAFDRVTAEPRYLSPTLRQQIVDAADPHLRHYLERQAPAGWERLSPEEQGQLLKALANYWVQLRGLTPGEPNPTR